jgi:acyl carrier protein
MLNTDELRSYLADLAGLDVGEVNDDTTFFSSGVLDSFDLVRVLAFIEGKIGKRISPIDINPRNFDSIARIAAFTDSLG